MRSQFALIVFAAPFALFHGILAAPSCIPDTSTTFCDPSRPITGSQMRSIFNTFVDQFYFKRDFQGAMKKFVSSNLIQHNPQIANGSQAQVEVVTSILANYDGPEFELAGTGLPITGVADIYRFEGSCMVEHWDVIEGLPPNSTNPMPFRK
ncbi:hypothetical protein TrVGV298_008132 [Trichoderma virens]|nr:hypothetical protein TrVGV298_008132 [Trichoderma virens]